MKILAQNQNDVFQTVLNATIQKVQLIRSRMILYLS